MKYLIVFMYRDARDTWGSFTKKEHKAQLKHLKCRGAEILNASKMKVKVEIAKTVKIPKIKLKKWRK